MNAATLNVTCSKSKLSGEIRKCTPRQECRCTKRKNKKTGGGPPPKSPDMEDEILMSLIPEEFMVDSNVYDCDDIVQVEEPSPDIDDDLEIVLSNEQIPEEASKENLNFTPSTTTKKQKQDKRSKLTTTGEDLYLEAAIKAKEIESELVQRKILVEIDNLAADDRRKEEEHQLRMRHMEEQHQLRQNLMKKNGVKMEEK